MGQRSAVEVIKPPAGGGIEGLRPLSTAQLGVWSAQAFDPERPVLNIAEWLEIAGPLDPAAFREAVRSAVAWTDALHVRFVETDEGPRQYLEPPADWEMFYADLRGEPDPRAAAGKWMRRDAARADDLYHGPLFTLALFRIGPHHFLYYQRFHHIVMDGASLSLFAQRVAALYSALAEGRPAERPKGGSWLDVLDEEAAYRRSDQLATDREYWLGRFAGRPDPLTLSGLPPARSNRLIVRSGSLPRPVVEALRAASEGMGLTRIVTAAAALYLYRLTGARDLPLGITLAARTGARTRRTPGMVSNLLPLRLAIDPRASFAELMEHAWERTWEALQHQQYRGEDLRHDLGLRPDEASTYGLRVNIQSFDYNLRLPGCRIVDFDRIANGPVEELTVVIYDTNLDGADLRIDFDADAEHYTAEVLAAHHRRFLELLTRLATAPEASLHRIEILAPEERRALVEGFNVTRRPVPGPAPTLPQRFEAQVARTPGATALIAEGLELSYAELDARANRLAHYLIAMGVGPERRVGICMNRSAEMLVALLGILKTGGAYVPLDPDFPRARLELVLADAAPALVLGETALTNRLPETTGVLELDALRTRAELEDAPAYAPTDHERTAPLQPEHPAYVIYTSGSTGVPKGVVIEHAALSAFFDAMAEHLPLGPGDRQLAITTISFDISILELFLPLSRGAAVVLATRDTARDPARLWELVRLRGVTAMQATPSHWEVLAQQDPSLRLEGLRVLCGGEALPVELARALRRLAGGGVWNVYGPTEATIWASVHEVGEADVADGAAAVVPIGRPLGGYRMYVLDEGLEPAPTGVPGELYIAGAGLARGYFGRPALTGERFVPDPHGAAGSRMYRTGDKARWRGDGVLEFLGRVDQQVKIRGFRIELGDIEAAMAAHPSVARVATAVCDGGPAGKQLVGYVVPAPGVVVDAAGLRRHVAERLPDYMVPAAIVPLDALPMTPNGKLDRKALPAPQWEGRLADSAAVLPRDATELALAEMWQQLLGLERVGVHDDFFELGGHSLLVIRLVTLIRKQMGVAMPLNVIFQAPTIAQMAARLRQEAPGSPAHAAPSRNGTADPPFFCLSWGPTLARHLGGYPVHPLDLSEGELRAIVRIEETAAYLNGKLRAFQPEGPYLLGGFCRMGVLAFEMAVQLVAQGERVGLLVLFDAPAILRPWRALRLMEDLGKLASFLRRWAGGDPEARFADMLRKIKGRSRGLVDELPLPAIQAIRGEVAYSLPLEQAIDRYRPRVYPCRITLARPTDGFRDPRDSVEIWRLLARGGLEVWDVPGNHVTMFEEPNVQTLAGRLLAQLEDLRMASSTTP
jgi:nonribosomal peptide synthetase DhbF